MAREFTELPSSSEVPDDLVSVPVPGGQSVLVGAETLRDRHVAVSDAVSENPPENWITHLITGALTNAYVGYLVHKGHALSDAIEASEDPVLRYQLLHQSMEDKDKALNMALTLFSQIRGDKPREAT